VEEGVVDDLGEMGEGDFDCGGGDHGWRWSWRWEMRLRRQRWVGIHGAMDGWISPNLR
jgi:hypothetical protein